MLITRAKVDPVTVAARLGHADPGMTLRVYSHAAEERIINWGGYYLASVLDDFTRYIIAWKLSPTMGATDVTETLDEAIAIKSVD